MKKKRSALASTLALDPEANPNPDQKWISSSISIENVSSELSSEMQEAA